MSEIPAHIQSELAAIQSRNAFRELRTVSGLIDFTSNDYLGLAKMQFPLQELPGSGGSRLLSGNHAVHESLERLCADVFQGESALLFGSGYLANLGVLSALPHRSDVVFYDEKCHASIKDGLRLSKAAFFSFRHNDLDDLERKLAECTAQAWVVTEGLFSMDGTIPALQRLAEVCRKYKAFAIVDEAHSTGILGPNGAGICAEAGLADFPLVRIHAFGKAVGRSGAVAVCPATIRDYLINRSRPFIYTTAPPPEVAESLLHAIAALCDADQARKQLLENIGYAQSLPILGKAVLPFSPIVPVLFPGNDAAKNAASSLQKMGLDVRAILSPTVPVGGERLRIILHSFNTVEEIALLDRSIAELQQS